MPFVKKQPKVFMNHIVVNADQKPIRPRPIPTIQISDRFNKPKGIKFK